jgi:glycosyltransferase involved in cell wall biosynthesis
LLLADINSSHTIKWATSLVEKGVDITIFSLSAALESNYHTYKHIKIVTLGQTVTRNEGSMLKLKYLQGLLLIRETINNFKPDIVHAHYASSYGLLGALIGFHPLVTSVWGSDVFSFPKKSIFHKWVIAYNLKRADCVLSTSHIMANETRKYTNKFIKVTPFGIKLDVFKVKAVDSLFRSGDIVIGTVKTLEHQYGIEYLIRSFHALRNKHPKLPLKLLVVGGGSIESNLKTLSSHLDMDDCTVFTGPVPYDKVPKYHNMMTITVFPSNNESFGVAVLEASACEKAVVVSNIGGLPEVVEDGVTGIVVPNKDVLATATAIERLVLDKELRLKMGKAGRERVKRLYDWNANVLQMIDIYNELVPNIGLKEPN